jgi:hypothetical protein
MSDGARDDTYGQVINQNNIMGRKSRGCNIIDALLKSLKMGRGRGGYKGETRWYWRRG